MMSLYHVSKNVADWSRDRDLVAVSQPNREGRRCGNTAVPCSYLHTAVEAVMKYVSTRGGDSATFQEAISLG